MGYYSEVMIKCEEKAYQSLISMIEKEDLYRTVWRTREGDYLIKIPEIKWYRGELHGETNDFYTLFEEFDKKHIEDSHDGYGYVMKRFGEEDDDYEEVRNDYGLDIIFHREFIPDYKAKRIYHKEPRRW